MYVGPTTSEVARVENSYRHRIHTLDPSLAHKERKDLISRQHYSKSRKGRRPGIINLEHLLFKKVYCTQAIHEYEGIWFSKGLKYYRLVEKLGKSILMPSRCSQQAVAN